MPDERPDENGENPLLQEMLGDARDQYAKEVYGEAEQTPPLVSKKSTREALVAEIDARVSAQVAEFLHHPAVQRLEAAWQALKHLVDRVEFNENVRVELVNCSKKDLAEDFEEAIDVTVSGLYQRLCEPELQPSDDAPVTLIVADYDFDHRQQDTELLGHCAAVAADAHAPFIANASPRFFGCESFAEPSGLGDLERVFQSPRYASWDSFRSSEDARYVALCAPRFLLRSPHEKADACLWGPASHAFAIQVAETFAKHRWFDGLADLNRTGSGVGFAGAGRRNCDELPAVGQVEVALSERQMRDLSAQGFIALRDRQEAPAAPFSANSTQRPKRFSDTPEGRAMELNHRAGAQLPNVLNICRVAHFLEALGREVGASQGAGSLESALQQWLWEHVSETDASDAEGDRGKPFREARIRVSARDYYRYELEARPSREELDFTVWVAGTLGEVA
jgi:type VI secretion system protein ImpC